MLEVFKTVEKKRTELEELQIIVQATEITTVESFKKLEINLEKAIHNLRAKT